MKTEADCRYKDEKPEGIVVELADVVIRILDYCGRHGINIEAPLEIGGACLEKCEIPELVAECHSVISKAYDKPEIASVYFAECISLIAFWVKENGGDLDEAIVLKHEYNKSRPYRHGGKKC